MGLKGHRRLLEPVLRSLAPKPRAQLQAALEILLADPMDRRLDVRRLQGEVEGIPVYRLRVGDLRVVFSIDGQTVRLHRIFPRREGYGWLERLG